MTENSSPNNELSVELVQHVDSLVGEVQGLKAVLHRRNQALAGAAVLVILIGITWITLLLKLNGVSNVIQQQAVTNEVSILENRLRTEGCIIEPIITVFESPRDERLPALDECKRADKQRLERDLTDARKRLSEASD